MLAAIQVAPVQFTSRLVACERPLLPAPLAGSAVGPGSVQRMVQEAVRERTQTRAWMTWLRRYLTPTARRARLQALRDSATRRAASQGKEGTYVPVRQGR